MPHSKTRPPAPKERPVALAITGTPPLGARRPSAERFTPTPTFEGPRQTSTAGTSRGDTIGLVVFSILIVLGLLAATRAFLVM